MIYFIILVTILFGTSLSSHSIELLPFYCAYYFLSFIVLRSFDYGKDYYLSFQRPIAESTENKLLVAGHEMNSDVESNKQEDRFLNLFDPKRLVKRKVVNGIIFFGGLWFFYSKIGAEISLNTLIPLVGCFLVMNSFYVGHLLLVLLLNSMVVTYNYSSEVPYFYYLFYICLFLSSLYLISNHKGHFGGRKIVSLVILALLFLTSSFGFSWILPKDSPPLEQKSKMSRNESKMLSDYVMQNKEQLLKLHKKNPKSGDQKEIQESIGNSLSEMDSLQQAIKKPSFTEEEKRKLLQRMQRFTDQQRSLSEKLGHQSELDLNKISFTEKEQDILNGMRIDQTGKLSNEEEKMLRDYISRAQMTGISQKEIEDINSVLGRKELTQTDKQNLKDSVIKNVKGALPYEKLKLTSEKEKAEIFKPLEKKPKSSEFMEKLKRFVPFLIGILLFFFVQYFLKKKGVRKVEAFDPETLNQLKAEWKVLRKLTLSPRDEVIYYYNLFHDSLQKIHYSAHEAPPSCIIYEDMKKNNLELDKPTLVITEVFAQCYYGGMDVTPDALKVFRKALRKILTVYQLN